MSLMLETTNLGESTQKVSLNLTNSVKQIYFSSINFNELLKITATHEFLVTQLIIIG